VPIGLGAGRFGNFINGELWGRATDLPWAVVFPNKLAGGLPRHPSQVYELLLEGVLLFPIVWLFSSKPRPTMAVSGLFALCYGLFRFTVEFARQPDAHLGFLAFDWMTMGQILSTPLIIVGLILLWLAYSKKNSPQSNTAIPSKN
jgi:phosphatidylglycerol:prolipoprotein diacylglycerol transferase